MKKLVFIIFSISLVNSWSHAECRRVGLQTDSITGAITRISFCQEMSPKSTSSKEKQNGILDTAMNWMLETDGSQYGWIDDKYGWGLGYMTIEGEPYSWKLPTEVSDNGLNATYLIGDIELSVCRCPTTDGFRETYTFTNTSPDSKQLNNIGIYTPWNDNYPNAEECMTARCNAHIWAGGESAYVMARRMDGNGPGVALMLEKGRIDDYDIWERGMDKNHSNFRGVIALCPSDTTLKSMQALTLQWQLFPHTGWDDFEQKAVERGATMVAADKYVYQVGDTATISVRTAEETQLYKYPIDRLGDIIVTDKSLDISTPRAFKCQLLGISSPDILLQRRADFIVNHQQMNDTANVSHGAYMVYDNELEKIYENTGSRKSSDTNDGRERIGMGIFLTAWYQLHPSDKLLTSLLRYADFVRTKLQDENGTIWDSSTDRQQQRGYNYPWVADFYLRMYEVTADNQFAVDAYTIMRQYFKRFGHSFYAINIPVLKSQQVLTKAGLHAECDTLMNLYKQTAHTFCKRGLNFPKSEVNYEQSIIAPAFDLLCQVWLATGDDSCIEGIEELLPATLCFNGRQPSYHLNDIAIRHWDGFWFGKRQLFGDTFPHYWSTVTAVALHRLAKIRNAQGRTFEAVECQRRAENITLQNLCLFFEDGRASCAYINPRRVNGIEASCYDPFANDQDWAAAYYLDVLRNRP